MYPRQRIDNRETRIHRNYKYDARRIQLLRIECSVERREAHGLHDTVYEPRQTEDESNLRGFKAKSTRGNRGREEYREQRNVGVVEKREQRMVHKYTCETPGEELRDIRS